MTTIEIKNLVDRLGEARAEAKVIKDEIKVIEAALKGLGASRFDGDYFTATVSRFERMTTAWKDIATKLKASKYMVETYSKASNVCTVKVTAHAK